MKIVKKFILIIPILFFACDDGQISESNNSLFGNYESSTFIEPGPSDGGVNILESGGYVKVRLYDGFTFAAEIFIPDSAESNFPKGLWSYEGDFLLKKDTINFMPGNFIFEQLSRKENVNQLETYDVPMRGRPFKIILTKNSY